ncbi:Abi family protein [Acinetobacter sp. dk771]|uniref:Abi family protein n=1 Tax=Acinetobacter wanghuae TaxID=2662362 RepID=A0AA90W8K4_9GAMM|nr:Abi family protein [Acinetobacter wanghuae]MQW93034.1 Abi family protein [Acinetobacter wanghuae]
MIQFIKQAKSNQEHLQTWQQRGLIISDLARADRYLSFIGYYRLSAYTIPFQQAITANSTVLHQFKANTSFDDVLNLYIFDRELRLLVMDAIERIEVAIRAQICNVLCDQSSDAFWYTDEQHFSHNYAHKRLLASIERQLLDEKSRLERDEKAIDKRPLSQADKDALKEKVRKENFLRHYLSKYDSPKLPPSWMMIEMLTWGELSHLYVGLKSNPAKKQIAKNLGLQAEILESWLKSLNDVRNLCAHHSRLWNKEHGRSIKIPTSNTIQWLQSPVVLSHSAIRHEKRTYIVLVAMQSLLYTISPNSAWAKRLKTLLDQYPSISKANMGMPELWHQDQFWQQALY